MSNIPPALPPDDQTPPPLPRPTQGGRSDFTEALGEMRANTEEKLTAGLRLWKALDGPTQVFLGGLAATAFCGCFFDIAEVSLKLGELELTNETNTSIIGSGFFGFLAMLGAIAGMVLWWHDKKAITKAPWATKAFLGVAAGSASFIMWVGLRMNSIGGDLPQAKSVDIDLTLLGYWLPLAGALAATYVAFKRWAAANSGRGF